MLVGALACEDNANSDPVEDVGTDAGADGGVDTCSPTTCNAHGDCDEAQGHVTCSCDDGWDGQFCSECDEANGYHADGQGGCTTDPCLPDTCAAQNQACRVVGGQAECYTPRREDDCEAFKEMLSQRLLAELYDVEPQTEGAIDHYELSTPLSTRHFANYAAGEIYGIAHTPKRFERSFLRAHTPVDNLYMTGQDIATCGVGGALSASMITVGLLKTDITRKVYAET